MTNTAKESGCTEKHAHGTQEWAESTVNIQNGCENDCKYCYAKALAVRYGRATSDSWRKPVLNQRALEKRYIRRGGRIMFPSTHDVTPANIEHCLKVLKKLLEAVNGVLVVSKPDPECVRRMCRMMEPYKGRVRRRIMFRFTIGSADDSVLGYWEPGAPSFAQRLEALKHAHSQGFDTSVSMEPMLDSDPGAVIDAVSPYVTDKIWLGKANMLNHRVSINCPGDTEALTRADALVREQSDDAVMRLYAKYRGNPLIRWKDSIKKVVGLKRPSEKGLDI